MTLRSILLLCAAALVITGSSSCTKEFTCHCDIKYTGQPLLPDSSSREYTVRDTKDKAKSICEQNSEHAQKNGITTDENCHLF